MVFKLCFACTHTCSHIWKCLQFIMHTHIHIKRRKDNMSYIQFDPVEYLLCLLAMSGIWIQWHIMPDVWLYDLIERGTVKYTDKKYIKINWSQCRNWDHYAKQCKKICMACCFWALSLAKIIYVKNRITEGWNSMREKKGHVLKVFLWAQNKGMVGK